MDKKQDIIDAAFELFCAKGYHLSVSELAKAVDIKPPSLYSHFESKDQILEIMIREEINFYYDCLKDKMIQLESLTCKEAMKSLYYFVIEYFAERKRLYFWRTIPLIPNEELKKICSQMIADKDQFFIQKLKQCFLNGIERGEIKSDITYSHLQLYFFMIQGVLDGMLMYSEFGKDLNIEGIYNAFWNSICASDQGASV